MPSGTSMERPDIYVLARILERLWREDGAMLKTRLQVATNMNYDLLQRYLDWMEARQFIIYEERAGHEMVGLAPKGKEAYIKIVHVVNEILRSH